MRRALALAVVLFAATPALAANTDRAGEAGLAGRYACEGMSPAGIAYHGLVDIVRLDDTFRVVWTITAGEGDVQQVTGVGILSNGVFATSYFGGGPAVGVYRIDGQKLIGEWTIGGADGTTYAETLTRLTSDEEQQLESPPHVSPEERTPPRLPAAFHEARVQ